jgi:myo-inositol 2-dehydrogenase / D-chiro-inositol 1-dehydrogenase
MKIGIVGAGKIAEKHISGYQALGINNIIIFDKNKFAAERLAKQYNLTVAKHLNEITSKTDITDVCTPVKTHKTIILEALTHKKHIFCEKPLCETIDEAEEIKQALKKSNTRLMTGYLYRFHPRFQEVKKWLEDELIGSIHFGIFRIGGRGNHRKWKHIKETGGGCINEMLIHKLDLINFLLGPPSNIKLLTCDTILKQRSIDGESFIATAEDNLALSLQTNSAKIICQADFTTPCYMEYLELHGAKGSIFTSLLDKFPTILHLTEASTHYQQGDNIAPPQPIINLFKSELSHFIDSITNNTQNTNNIDDSIALLRMTTEIQKQAEKFDD